MQIQLKQAAIEAAITDYLGKMGISAPVKSITFVTTRKGGTTTSAEVEVADSIAAAPAPKHDRLSEAGAPMRTQEIRSTDQDVMPAHNAVEGVTPVEAVMNTVEEVVAAEPVAANEEEADPVKTNSLFG